MCILTSDLGLPEDIVHRSVLKFFLTVAVTIISKRFVKLGKTVYYRI